MIIERVFAVKKRTWQSKQIAGSLLASLTARPIALKRVPAEGFKAYAIDLVLTL